MCGTRNLTMLANQAALRCDQPGCECIAVVKNKCQYHLKLTCREIGCYRLKSLASTNEMYCGIHRRKEIFSCYFPSNGKIGFVCDMHLRRANRVKKVHAQIIKCYFKQSCIGCNIEIKTGRIVVLKL